MTPTPAKDRILFIDKDISMQFLMKAFLDDQFHLVAAGSAEEGLTLLESEIPFDIVISGFTLLAMNGLEFLRQAGEIWPKSVRILMSGGGGYAADINQAINEGHVNRLMLKPFCMSNLCDELKNELASGRNIIAAAEREI